MTRPRFHLAFPVTNLDEARGFYVGVLGCREGRSSERWVDFEFFGHQLTAHLADAGEPTPSNVVDGDAIPVRHFGAILEWHEWEAMAQRLEVAGIEFMIRPRVRFDGAPGEQGTFFVRDPSRNVIELKSFRDDEQIFARRPPD